MTLSRKSPAKPSQLKPPPLIFEAIGTSWSVQFYESISDSKLQAIEPVILTRIDDFDKTYSRFRNDSWVSTLARHGGQHTLPPDAAPLFAVYKQFYDLTNGRFTPLIGQMLIDAGYDADYSFRPQQLQQPPSWESMITIDQNSIALAKPAMLDFGAAGKGYLVDIIVKLIADYGISGFSVNAGGDMYYHLQTVEPATVGLEHPLHDDEIIGTAQISNQAICGSASNRRRWASYHHTIDPITLQSPEELLAVWVVADTTMLADALTTALCFTQAAKLSRYVSFEYALVLADGSLSYSKNFPGTFF